MIIFTADWHIRSTRPKSRTDNFLETQERKTRFIFQLAQDLNCPLVIAGDFFEVSRPGEFIKRWIINLISEYGIQIYCVPGQHDLPSHNLALVKDSGIGVIEAAGAITLLTDPTKPIISGNYAIFGCPFGTVPDDILFKKAINSKIKVLVWHHMVIKEPIWEDQVVDMAGKILRIYPQFDIIATGDNHQSFVYDRKGKWLINAGSLFRKKSNEIGHRPSVYKYDNGAVEIVYIPIEEDVFDISHIQEAKGKVFRHGEFIDKLHKGFVSGIDLNKNFLSYFKINKTRKPVENLVWECVPD